jgi:hypothetical protein
VGSDKARNSYDLNRRWRSVVAQQGRVTLEADVNEAWAIANEELREEVLGIVGPSGTPDDDGYAVSDAGRRGDFKVGAGTLYVGGLRHVLDSVVYYSEQPEWLDHAGDPDWLGPREAAAKERALVWWWGGEQEVSAAEDSALREVALGGPDTAARRRILQRFKVRPTDADSCEQAWAEAATAWLSEQGLVFDAQEMRLRSRARLKLGFTEPTEQPKLCEPEALGGYLGADNQLVRVQVHSWDAATGKGTLLWGFDNASFLYRADVLNSRTLKLKSRPPDDARNPRPKQAVEILRAAVHLGSDDFIASTSGEAMTLTSAYSADSQLLTLPDELAYTSGQVFLRVWEQQLAFTAGTAVPLGSTGLEVTLTTETRTAFHVGDHWLLAVRPSTPTKVYPERFLDGPQPPDGPRLWACPLALVSWQGRQLTVVDDCREQFDNLVELTKQRPTAAGGCCNTVVTPETFDVRELQKLVEKATEAKQPLVVCFKPGTYTFNEPLLLQRSADVTFEGCHEPVVWQAPPDAGELFQHGLAVLADVTGITFRNITFHLPLAPLPDGVFSRLTVEERSALGSVAERKRSAIGLRPITATGLTIERCRFLFPPEDPDGFVFAAGIFAPGRCLSWRIRDNTFSMKEEGGDESHGRRSAMFGVLVVPASDIPGAQANGWQTSPVADDVRLEQNDVSGLACAAFIAATLGKVGVEGNRVRDCQMGIVLSALRTWVLLLQVFGTHDHGGDEPVASALAAVNTFFSLAASALGRAYPLPVIVEPPPPWVLEVTRETLAQSMGELAAAVGKLDEGILKDIAASLPSRPEAGEWQGPVAAVPGTAPDRLLQLIGQANVIRCDAAESPGAPVVVFGDPEPTASSSTVTGNQLTAGYAGPTAALAFAGMTAVTGNTVVNEHEEGKSLVVHAPTGPHSAALAAITGNILRGPPLLPPRLNLVPPLDSWEPLNAVV